MSGAGAQVDYQFVGLPLSPAVIQVLALELFAGRSARRADVSARCAEVHSKRGGANGGASALQQTKKALRALEAKGLAIKTGAYGLWRFMASDTALRPSVGPGEDDGALGRLPEAGLEVERWLGEGEQLLYAYALPTFREFAEVRNADAWPIKVGMSSNHSLDRILDQIGTATPEWPTVHIAYRCDDARRLERIVHEVLKLRRCHLTDVPGAEWFLTSPSAILDIITLALNRSEPPR